MSFEEELVKRLNYLIEDPNVRSDIGRLLLQSVRASGATHNHPTIQVTTQGQMSVLGLLNGIAGTVFAGEREGEGKVSALFDSKDELLSFALTEHL